MSNEAAASNNGDRAAKSNIEVRNLYKIFGPRPQEVLPQIRAGAGKDKLLADTGHTVGLSDVNLRIDQAETFVVMGLSGSGKSTFVRCVNRLIEPTAGQVLVGGVDILELSAADLKALRRTRMSMVFQRFGLLPHRSVVQNVAYGLRVQGVSKEERLQRAGRWIEVVGLQGYEQQRPSQLSGGMQQRVGLARALCTDPDILLMDEAFSALDPLIRRDMQDELIRLQAELNKTIVFITHDLDEALRLGDRIAILKDGAVVQIGTPVEIITQPADAYVQEFVRDVNRARVLHAREVMEEVQPLPLATAPKKAHEVLRKGLHRNGFVTDRENRFRGLVRTEDVKQAAARGDRDLGGIVRGNAPTVRAAQSLDELLGTTADNDLPIAVLGEQDRLLGFLTRQTTLAALAGDRDRNGNDDKPEKPAEQPPAKQAPAKQK